MIEASAPKGAQAALRTIRLLKLFTVERPQLRLNDISSMAALNKTTAHRLLSALLSEDMLVRNGDSGQYGLGPGAMALGVQAITGNDLRQHARPYLQRLAEDTGETATLEVPLANTMLILDEVSGKHFVGAAGNVGTCWPIHATSTGKVLMAFDDLGAKRLDGPLKKLTEQTITKLKVLSDQLEIVRMRGYAETVDELEEGFSGVGAVLRSHTGRVLGALSVCGPSSRMPSERRAELGSALRATADTMVATFQSMA